MKQAKPLEFPFNLGNDFSGIIKEVGKDILRDRQGDEVYGQASVTKGGTGAFAEIALTNAEYCNQT